MKYISLSLAGALAFAVTKPASAGTPQYDDVVVQEESGFADWWNGKYFTGNWFGVRDTLADYGLKFSGKYEGAYFGVVDSEGGSRGFWDQQVAFAAEQNFGKLLNIESLEGVKGFGSVRYRDSRKGADPNQFVEANSMFNPSNWISGVQWRLLSFGLEIGTASNLPVEDMIVLRGGWLQPQKEFVDQPLSKLFMNNAINSSKGIGGNIPFSSSFSTWGGTLEVKPLDIWYVKGGLFMAYPEATSSRNHGLAMEGFAQDPSRNGLMFMTETGVTPEFGASELPGKYAAGFYYYGNSRKSYNGQHYNEQWGLYWQADQMLFREASPEPEVVVYEKGPSDSKTVADAKSFKTPISIDPPELSKQGLSSFNLITFSPKYNNRFPFYFQSGLVYEGLIPGRDRDQTMIAIGFGSYSFYQIEALQEAGNVNQPNYTGVIEGGYRLKYSGWGYIQPFVQYIFRPAGTGNIQNATVLGFLTGVNF